MGHHASTSVLGLAIRRLYPLETVQDFDDNLPERQFDNFQFVCATNLLKPLATKGVFHRARLVCRFGSLAHTNG